jgi:hypothetical protein
MELMDGGIDCALVPVGPRDVATIRVVANLARPLVANPLTRAIRGSSRGTSALPSREMPCAEKVRRHRASGSM